MIIAFNKWYECTLQKKPDVNHSIPLAVVQKAYSTWMDAALASGMTFEQKKKSLPVAVPLIKITDHLQWGVAPWHH